MAFSWLINGGDPNYLVAGVPSSKCGCDKKTDPYVCFFHQKKATVKKPGVPDTFHESSGLFNGDLL